MSITSRPSQYFMPPLDASQSDKLGWLTEAKETGETYLKAQRGWSEIDRFVDIISGSADLKVPRGMSDISVNMLKRDVREQVATLANMRPLWGYKTDNDDHHKQAIVLNKMLRAWYYQPFVRQSIHDTLQYAAAGLGWLSPVWASSQIIAGRGDIALNVYGPRDVLPYGIGKDHDIQKAYVVTIRVETPIQQALAMYPLDIDKLAPSRATPTWMKKGVRRMQRFLSPLLNALGQGQGKEKDESPFPTVDIFHSYILDLSINETGKDIWMGQPGTKWRYKVPAYGSDIPTQVYENNQPTFRKATREDAMLFPLRRLTLWTEQGILYDDTSMWWHGKVPVVPFTLDRWVWDFLGYPMSKDGGSIQRAATRLFRALDDSANVKLDMPLAYDENAMGQGLMERINPRKPGQRVKVNMTQNEMPIKPVVPAEYYNVDAWVAGMPEKLYELMHHVLGTRDIQALAKAKQVPSGDSIEKIMELAGPLVADMSSSMEGSMMELGEMWKGLAFEFFDAKRRVQVLGPDGFTEEDYDFDPGNMIPSHLPDEFEKIKQNAALAKQNGAPYQPPESRATIVERARIHINSFYFHSVPGSLHQITQLTKKMLMSQLWKIQFPIDPWSVAEAMDIDNYGNPHQISQVLGISKEQIPDDKFGRWLLWRDLLAKMSPQQPQRGRHPSGQVPPTPMSKDQGGRTTVRESPR